MENKGLLDGGAVVAAGGHGCQDDLQVGDVVGDGVDVPVDARESPAVRLLSGLHVPQTGPQAALHLLLSPFQSHLQSPKLGLVHRSGLVSMEIVYEPADMWWSVMNQLTWRGHVMNH
ncbi:hypothetical protein F7725_010816 [Dissostichus mawsoni]|uniref:Uncharacterized protein n=1 Tax=Dissostichus mawsoni TaxID=36200 RepID=A0A7J5Z779_DISMA|nr:hypothetical protein F7725_010816 [Dissostichus mawsoni]